MEKNTPTFVLNGPLAGCAGVAVYTSVIGKRTAACTGRVIHCSLFKKMAGLCSPLCVSLVLFLVICCSKVEAAIGIIIIAYEL